MNKGKSGNQKSSEENVQENHLEKKKWKKKMKIGKVNKSKRITLKKSLVIWS